MPPSVISHPRLRAAGVGHRGPYHLIGRAFAQLEGMMEQAGLTGPDHHLVAVFHDDPAEVAAEALRSEAGVLLNGSDPAPAGSNELSLDGGKFLSARHVGSYGGLPEAWATLRNEVGKQGLRRRAAPGYEIYRNTPMTAAEGDLITDIFIPVE